MKYIEKHFFTKVLYLVVEYILNFSPESENFYFSENMLIDMHILIMLQYNELYTTRCEDYTLASNLITTLSAVYGLKYLDQSDLDRIYQSLARSIYKSANENNFEVILRFPNIGPNSIPLLKFFKL